MYTNYLLIQFYVDEFFLGFSIHPFNRFDPKESGTDNFK
jgi:hypothetical protein